MLDDKFGFSFLQKPASGERERSLHFITHHLTPERHFASVSSQHGMLQLRAPRGSLEGSVSNATLLEKIMKNIFPTRACVRVIFYIIEENCGKTRGGRLLLALFFSRRGKGD
jgi:hypothetical protein